MEWAEDLKQTLKKTVKKGRRAAADSSSANSNKPSSSSTSTPEQEKLSFDKDFLEDDSDNLDFKSVLMKTKGKSGGWADEAIKSGSGKSSRGKVNLIEMERFNPISSQSNQTSDDIPVIPDMDDVQDELVIQEMAEAPAISVNRVETYKELNSELLNHAAFTTLEDIDLSVLAKCLQNETILDEPDVVWTWEKLFTEVSAEVHADKPKSADLTAEFIN